MFIRAICFVSVIFSFILVSCVDQQETVVEEKDVYRTLALNSLPDTAFASGSFARAELLASDLQHDSAIVYYEKASEKYKKDQDWQNYLRCYNQMGKQALKKRAYARAMTYLNHALAIATEKLNKQDTLFADLYHNLGLTQFEAGQYSQAIDNLIQAINIRQAIHGEHHTDLADSYNTLGRVFQEMEQFDQALTFYEKALFIWKSLFGEKHIFVARCYNNMGLAYSNKGDYDKAFSFLEKALTICHTLEKQQDLELMGMCYGNIAGIYSDKVDYNKALEYHQKSLDIFLKTLGEKHPDVGAAYLNIGVINHKKGDYDQALAYYRKALSIKSATLGEQHPEVAFVYYNLGILYTEKGDYNQAMDLIDKSLKNLLPILGEDHPGISMLYNGMAEIFGRQHQYAQALTILEKSLSILLKAFGEAHPEVGNFYHNKGLLFLDQKDPDRALAALEKSQAIWVSTLGPKHPDVAVNLNCLGDVYRQKGNLTRALAYYQQALCANVQNFDEPDIYNNPPLTNILSENRLMQTLLDKAATFIERFETAKKNINDLEAAVSIYQVGARLIDQMRQGYKTEGTKLFIAEKATDFYDDAIQATLCLYHLNRMPKYQEMAFQYAEKNKAGILLESMLEVEAKHYAGIPDSLLAREQQLRIDLAFYERNLIEEELKRDECDSSKIAIWQDRVFNLKQAYVAMLQKLEKDYPDYYNLKYQNKTASVQEIQEQILDANTVLVEYFIGKDSTVIFTITRDDLSITSVPKDSRFDQQIQELHRGIVEQDDARYTRAAWSLYQALVQPVADRIGGKNLVIIPDGALSSVPFEALLTQSLDAESRLLDYGKLPFLVQDHSIRYSYSATLMLQTMKQEKVRTRRDFLAFAPIFPDGLPAGTRGADFFKENLALDSVASARRIKGYLPASEKEVTGIFNLFKDQYGFWQQLFSKKSRVYLATEAKELRLKSPDLRHYRYLHFATHGLVNDSNPALSGLVLAQDTTATEDGILHLGEIYNLDLNADLVVLSACETGLGQIVKGEGIIGLTRGFLYAGASNLLVSLWQVSDVSTADLMVDFYKNILGGLSQSEALRQAKQALIGRNPEYAKPYYWSAFILIGG